jgi:peptide/nickel transport system permease protein
MYSYIARRFAFGALTVIGVSIMVFVVMRILPGDPLVALFGRLPNLSEASAPTTCELGLSDPIGSSTSRG